MTAAARPAASTGAVRGRLHRPPDRGSHRPRHRGRATPGRIGRPGSARPSPRRRFACTQPPSPRHRDERGITTAEYAVGTAAGAGLAGLLYKLLTGGFGDQLLKTLFDHVLGLLGIG